MTYVLRSATRADVPILHELIARSIRALGRDDYSPRQIEGALLGAFGVDTALIADGTYFVVTAATGEIVGCGGWSRRRTLFGSDQRAERDETWLEPAEDAAKIRAFFVHPDHARRGIGTRLLNKSEHEARRVGFKRLEMMATLPGVRLYERHGYQAAAAVEYALPDGVTIHFVPMHKTLISP